MCGILGQINREKSINIKDKNLFITALNKLNHRGPDFQDIYLNKNIIFGHTRLSILDLDKRSNQPFEFENLVLTFNGEIYNFQEIKEELIEIGYNFKTTSDTEVLIKAYHKWGKNCVNKFEGMWAFVIFDKLKNKIFLSRDPIGEKPLVYNFSNDSFYFSSEIPSLLKLIKKYNIDYSILSNFNLQNFRHIPFPYTPYKNIFKLEPGTNLTLSLSSWNIKINKYFKLKKILIENNYKKQFIDIFNDVVKKTYYSDVPIGIFLSGGVDSSLIASQLKNRNIVAYTIGYNKFDPEIIRAKKIANFLKIKLKVFYFKDFLKDINLIELIKNNIKSLGEPIHLYQIIYSNLLLEEMKKDGIKVAIGGNGADELFFGYDGMNKLYLLSEIKKYLSILKLDFIFNLFKKTSFLSNNINSIKSKYYFNLLKNKTYILTKFRKFEYSNIFKKISFEVSNKNLINIFSWIGFRIENEHSITMVADISASQKGMEIRSPFLNPRILNFSNSLPIKYKLKSFFFKNKNKFILKEILSTFIPSNLVYTKKMGFGYNINLDNLIFDYKTEFDFYFENILPKIKMYSKDKVLEMYKLHLSKEKNYQEELIEILIVCIWFEINFN